MPVITVNFPTEEESELLRRFSVNRNYLQALAGSITATYGRREMLYAGLRSAVEGTPQYHKIQRAPANLDEVRRFLTLAWTSEIQLHLPALMGNRSMLAFAANGMTGVADDHTATLRTVSTQIPARHVP